MTAREEKAALRAHCLTLRRAMPEGVRAAADRALCDLLFSLPALADADLVLGYFPVRGEPDLRPFLRAVAAQGLPTAFPRCETAARGGEMRFLLAEVDGLSAPPAGAPAAHPTARTLCILPGLAASADGARLGYGGGFYDRFLDTFGGICLFPVYEALLLPTLPTEPHDRPVDLILTEKGVRHVVSS